MPKRAPRGGKNPSDGKGHQSRQRKILRVQRGATRLPNEPGDKLVSLGAVKCVLEVFVRSLKLLRAFVRDNLEHKKRLAKELSVLSQQLRYDLGQIDLICEIFSDNYKLCS